MLSSFHNVLCDSKQGLQWAYKKGLNKSAIIRTSSPAMLLDNNPNIVHIEERWTIEELKQFQTTIQRFSENLYDMALSVPGTSHEEALCVSWCGVQFQKIIFKAACLIEEDFIEPVLFISIPENVGPYENRMNAPWREIFLNSLNFTSVSCELNNNEWENLTTKGIGWYKRLMVGGSETIVYRIALKVMKYLPSWVFNREILIPNENELVIETASKLALKGVRVAKISLDSSNCILKKNNREPLKIKIKPIIKSRIRKWVIKEFSGQCESLFVSELDKYFYDFDNCVEEWRYVFSQNTHMKKAILTNSPANVKNKALSFLCQQYGVPFISVQHGVTFEISALHGEVSTVFDNTSPGCLLTYNKKSRDVQNLSHFAKAVPYVSGMSLRHIRMKRFKNSKTSQIPIVYISTNLYQGNIGHFISWLTDYGKAIKEDQFISNVLEKIPYRVCYKAYPEENRRYADVDPILKKVNDSDNIELFDKKIDMRYLLDNHRIIITTSATSTLGWPVMSDMPLVFINRRDRAPLTNEAYSYMSKGLFVFNDDMKYFHQTLLDFLSQPIVEIEQQWKKKSDAREIMVKKFFTEYNGNAGKRSAEMILKEYF